MEELSEEELELINPRRKRDKGRVVRFCFRPEGLYIKEFHMEQLDGAMEKKSAIGAMVNSEGIKDKIRDILVMESQNGYQET